MWVSVLLFLLQLSTPSGCDSRHGYFKSAGRICLLPVDMDESQQLLFASLREAEGRLASVLQDQFDFTVSKVSVRITALNARISFLEARRDAASGRPVAVYQTGIDRLISARSRLLEKEGEVSRSDLTVTRLDRWILELKRELNASIP